MEGYRISKSWLTRNLDPGGPEWSWAVERFVPTGSRATNSGTSTNRLHPLSTPGQWVSPSSATVSLSARLSPPFTDPRQPCGLGRRMPPLTSKPDKCPECGSKKVARILNGLPIVDEELERRLNTREVTLGGCCVMRYREIALIAYRQLDDQTNRNIAEVLNMHAA